SQGIVVVPTTFSLSDGLHTYTPENTWRSSFEFWTSPGGGILGWYMSVFQTIEPPLGFSCDPDCPEAILFSQHAPWQPYGRDYAQIDDIPHRPTDYVYAYSSSTGTWTGIGQPVAEPSPLPLLIIGSAFVVTTFYKRTRQHGRQP